MYARVTTVEFETAADRVAALKLMSDEVERIRGMHGFHAAYFLDVDELRIVSIVMFVTEPQLQRIRDEDEAVRDRLGGAGVTFSDAEECRVMAFASEA